MKCPNYTLSLLRFHETRNVSHYIRLPPLYYYVLYWLIFVVKTCYTTSCIGIKTERREEDSPENFIYQKRI